MGFLEKTFEVRTPIDAPNRDAIINMYIRCFSEKPPAIRRRGTDAKRVQWYFLGRRLNFRESLDISIPPNKLLATKRTRNKRNLQSLLERVVRNPERVKMAKEKYLTT